MPHRYLCYPKCLGTTLAKEQLRQNRDTATAMMALNHLGQHNGSSSYSGGAGSLGPAPGARNGGARGADSFVYADGLFWMGFRTPHIVVPARDSVAMVRGYYSKVAEACERVLRMEEETFSSKRQASSSLPPLSHQRYRRRCRALIVGAGRGASTSCLSSLFAIKQKIVVDPAEHIFKRPPGGVVSRLSGAGAGYIQHWQMTGLEAVSRLLSGPSPFGDGETLELDHLGTGSSPHPWCGEESLIERSSTREKMLSPLQPAAKEPQKHDNIVPTFAVFLCYAHENLRDSVELFRRARPLFERPTLCVITFAETQKTGGLLGQLREMGLVNLDQIQLFANGKHQQTLVGEVL